MAFGLFFISGNVGLLTDIIAHTVMPCSKRTKTVAQAVIGRVNGSGIIITIRIPTKNKPVYGFFNKHSDNFTAKYKASCTKSYVGQNDTSS